MLPSGIQQTFVNRVGWAATYMKKAGLLEATRRGYCRITQRGRDLFKRKPPKINVKLLSRHPEFKQFQSFKGARSGDGGIDGVIAVGAADDRQRRGRIDRFIVSSQEDRFGLL